MNELTREKVLLYWALSEAISTRWPDYYQKHLGKRNIASLRTLQDPEDISPEIQKRVLELLRCRRYYMLESHFDPCTRFSFVLVEPEELVELVLSHHVSNTKTPVTLRKFMSGSYSPDAAHDSRNAAKHMLDAPEKIAFFGYPILAPDPVFNCETLIDGFGRSIARILELEKHGKADPIVMIRCEK